MRSLGRPLLLFILGIFAPACGDSEPPPPPGLFMTIDAQSVRGTYAREGAVVSFHAIELDGGEGARLELEIDGKPLDLTLDLAGREVTEDGHGSTFTLADRALLLALRDAIGEAHPEVIDTLAGSLLVRSSDRYAEVPVGVARTRLSISIGDAVGPAKGDIVQYGCGDNGTDCYPGTSGQGWAVFSASGACQAETASYGDGVCRGRCGIGCSWWDEDYTWDCFDHDVCLDYYSSACDDEFDDAQDDWVVTWGYWCTSGSSRSKPPSVPVCGNAQVEVSEGCDDGNTAEGDGCSPSCQLEPVSIAASLTAISLDREQLIGLHLNGTFADGSVVDLTGAAAWTSSDPQVATLEAVPGRVRGVQAGSAVIAARFAGRTAEISVSVRDAACAVAINEVQTAGESAADEWIEIYNGCSQAADMTGWQLVYRSGKATGATGEISLLALAGAIGPGEYRLYTSTGAASASRLIADAQWGRGGSFGALAGSSGGVAVRAGDGTVIDAVGYGALAAGHPFAEGGQPASAPQVGGSCARAPFDGADSDVNAQDLAARAPGTVTPRAAN